MSSSRETITLRERQDYQFDIDFGAGRPLLLADEPAPLGQGTGPTPVQLLEAAVGNCLSASLLFALRKFKQQPEPISCEVSSEVGRNPDGRMRVLQMDVRLTLGVPAAQLQQLPRVLETFENYCTVTQSVRSAIPVNLQVFDATGAQLK